MKIDEPFNPESKSGEPPAGLKFRLAEQKDFAALVDLLSERNPQTPRASIESSTQRELDTVQTDLNYKLYVAEITDSTDAETRERYPSEPVESALFKPGVTTRSEVVGFCRFYDSAGLPPEKKKFPSPEGWYGMGILVKPTYRRQGIARYLTEKRIEVLKSLGINALYSIVDSTNETSKRMHAEFGFKVVATAPGFLHLSLESGAGYLYRLELVT